MIPRSTTRAVTNQAMVVTADGTLPVTLHGCSAIAVAAPGTVRAPSRPAPKAMTKSAITASRPKRSAAGPRPTRAARAITTASAAGATMSR